MIAAITFFCALYLTLVLGLRVADSMQMRRSFNATALALLTCAAWAILFYLTFANQTQ
jgi:hypothetical protein